MVKSYVIRGWFEDSLDYLFDRHVPKWRMNKIPQVEKYTFTDYNTDESNRVANEHELIPPGWTFGYRLFCGQGRGESGPDP